MANIFEHIYDTDKPISREHFFKLSLVLVVLQIIGVLAFTFIYFFKSDSPYDFLILFWCFIIFVEFPILYAYFIATVKRMWDILGENNLNIWMNLLFFIFSLIVIPVCIIMYVILILIPGKSDK